MLGENYPMAVALENKIALLIFANSPETECKRKVVGGSDKIFALLTRHTLHIAERSEIPYFHFTEKEQVGETFGERYVNAIKDLFDRGYEGLITIGNDSPGITLSHLTSARRALKAGKAAIGPSKDGGFYLLAVSRDTFSEDRFLNITWNSGSVCKQMLTILQASQQGIKVLNCLVDLDSTSDIGKILDDYINIPFSIYQLLVQSCKKTTSRIIPAEIRPTMLARRNFRNRGSPVLPL